VAAVVALMCVFGLGMCFALLGALKLKMVPQLGIDDSQFGTLGSSFMLSCLVMSLIVGLLCDKWGYKPIALLGFLVASACFFMLSRATSFNMALAAAILLGVGAMCLNTAGNTLIPVVLFDGKNPAAASNFGNTFFGLGLFITPFLTGWLFGKFPDAYAMNVTVLAIIILLPIIVALIAEYPASAAGFKFSEGASVLGQVAVLVSGLTLFLYIALEMSMNTWVTSYGAEVIRNATPDLAKETVDKQAANMMAVFAVAMMLGRLITSQIKAITRIGDKVIALMGLVIAAVLFAMTRVTNVSAVWVLVALVGLGCAPCFPTIVGVTFSKFVPKVYGSIFGVIFAIGLLGAVVFVKVIGVIAKGAGGSVQAGLSILSIVALVLIVVALVLGAVKGKGDIAAK